MNGKGTAADNGASRDWQAEAQFWQVKYFEQLLHSTQVITMLGRPTLLHAQQLQQAAKAAAAAGAAVPLADQVPQ